MKKKVFNQQNSKYISTEILNNYAFNFYYDMLKMLALSRFKYKNLPKSMDSRFLEELLFYNGSATLLKSDKYGFINTACSTNGEFNIYYKPTSLNCWSLNFSESRKLYTGLKNEESSENSCILMYNNKNLSGIHYYIEYFAYQLYELKRNIEININACKTPIIITGDDKTILSLRNAYLKYDGNEPVMAVNKKSINLSESLNALNTNVEYHADKIQIQIEKIMNEALTFLGINNTNFEKRERLNQDETNSNNEMINYMLYNYLDPREEAISQFNELFDTNVEVLINSDLENITKKLKSQISEYTQNFSMKEGEENGQYDNEPLRNNK